MANLFKKPCHGGGWGLPLPSDMSTAPRRKEDQTCKLLKRCGKLTLTVWTKYTVLFLFSLHKSISLLNTLFHWGGRAHVFFFVFFLFDLFIQVSENIFKGTLAVVLTATLEEITRVFYAYGDTSISWLLGFSFLLHIMSIWKYMT